MKKQKQMLSASINDDEEDIFPQNTENHSNEEIGDKAQVEMINKKRDREESQDLKVKKSKFEPISNDTKAPNTAIINNVINTNVVINPTIKTINQNQPNYPYYNNNILTTPRMPYNYNYYPNQTQYNLNNNSGYYHGVQHNNHNMAYNNYNYNYLQNNLGNHPYNNQYNNGQLIHGQNPAAASFIQQNLPKEKMFSIKNMPEITVGGFLQNKDMQTKYLSYIKPKNKDEQAVTADENIKNEEKVNDTNYDLNSNIKSPTINQGFTPSPTGFSSGPTYNYSTVTNYNISNYNFNQNMPSATSTIPSNLSVYNSSNNLQMISKISKPPVLNSSFLNTQPIIPNKPIPANLQELNYQKNVNQANYNSTGRFILSNPTVVETANEKDSKKKSLKDNNSAAKELPDTLKQYIEKSFGKCRTEEERKKCERILQKIITSAQKKDQLFTRNWDKYPLPQMSWEIEENTKKKNMSIKKNMLNDQELKKRDIRKGRFDLPDCDSEKQNNSPIKEEKIIQNREISIEEIAKTHIIIGTCTDLEKQYLRLTTLPNPSQVRPEHILKKSLKMLKKKWKNNEADYNYISEQFRSIRQDMIIQHMKNDFTLKVYETHARMALEKHDLDQFNQCQTQLVQLYADGIKGKEVEFLAYRIIYLALQNIKYEIVDLLREVKVSLRSVQEIKHSLNLRKALNESNFFEFFKLYKIAPNMASYLIEPFLNRYRMKALQVFAVGYFTETSVDFVCEKLAFQSKEECIKFLEENKIVLSNDKNTLRCKESLSSINSSNYIIIHNPTLSSEKIV